MTKNSLSNATSTSLFFALILMYLSSFFGLRSLTTFLDLSERFLEAFQNMSSDKGKEFITQEDILRSVTRFKNEKLMTGKMFKVEGTDGAQEEGEDVEFMRRRCREIAAEVYQAFQGESKGKGDEEKVKFAPFLKVASPCCVNALSSGYSAENELAAVDTSVAEKSAQPQSPHEQKQDYMYPRRYRNYEGEECSGSKPPPPSPAALTSLPYSTATILFSRAAVRSVTLNHTKKLLKKEEVRGSGRGAKDEDECEERSEERSERLRRSSNNRFVAGEELDL